MQELLQMPAVYWIMFGVILMIAEVFLPSFVLLIIGAAAIITAFISYMIDIPLTSQLIIWSFFSIALSLLWFKYLKPLQKNKTTTGLGSDTFIGETGIITKVHSSHTTSANAANKGMVRFTIPVLGSDEWACRSEQPLETGDRVCVQKIVGNEVLVQKI